MITVKVLGPGCMNCERLEAHAVRAAQQLRAERPDVEVEIQKVSDTAKFLDYGLLTTPGLVINEKLISSGRIPSPEQIADGLREAWGAAQAA